MTQQTCYWWLYTAVVSSYERLWAAISSHCVLKVARSLAQLRGGKQLYGELCFIRRLDRLKDIPNGA